MGDINTRFYAGTCVYANLNSIENTSYSSKSLDDLYGVVDVRKESFEEAFGLLYENEKKNGLTTYIEIIN